MEGGGAKRPTLPKMSHTYDEISHGYTIPKEDPENVLIT